MAVPRLAVPAALVWLLVAPVAGWALARTAGLERGPLLVQVTAFTPYAAVLSTIPVVVALLARNRWAAAVAGLACLALAVGVLPRAIGSRWTGTGTEARLTVMSVNLRLGQADPASIVDLVRTRDVDVLTLQEYTPAAEAALAEAGLTALLPYWERQPVDRAAGSAVYSRLPPSDVGLVHGWFYQARLVVDVGGQAVTVESVHPPPPVSQSGPAWAEGLRGQTPASEPGLRVLAGDFNATLDHAELRRLVGTGYRDAADTVGAGLVPTWPYYGPRLSVTPKVTIDHILVNGSIQVGGFTAVTVPQTDHRAIIATLYIGR